MNQGDRLMFSMEIEYELTPEVRIQSLNEMYWITIWRVYLVVMPVLIIYGIIMIMAGGKVLFNVLGWISLIFPIIMTTIAFRNQLYVRKMLLQEFDLAPDQKMQTKVMMDQKSFSIDRGTSKNQVAWSNITKMKKSKNFLFLMHKQTAVATIPLSVLNGEHLRFIQEMIGVK